MRFRTKLSGERGLVSTPLLGAVVVVVVMIATVLGSYFGG
jgi:hypothetical protein